MPSWRTGSSPVPGTCYMEHIFNTVLISISYGVLLFAFVYSIVSNYFYSTIRKDFLLLFLLVGSIVFVLSTLNLILFLTNVTFNLWITDLTITVVLLFMIKIFKIAFSKNFFISELILIGFAVLVIVHKFIFVEHSVFFDLIPLFVILSMGIILFDMVKGIANKDQSYLNSELFFDYRHSLIGIIIVIILFVFKITFAKESSSFVFSNVILLVIFLSLFFSKMKFVFILRDKLVEENQKFETLYRTMVDEMLVGKDIIDKLLPKKKNVKGLNFEIYFKPAILVGGDFVDIFKILENKYVAYVADISGHGVAAGIVVSMLKALILKEFAQSNSVSSTVRVVNEDFNLLIKDTGRYATMFIVLIDKEKKVFEYVSCGHIDCLYWNSKINEFFFLSSTAPILGLLNKVDVYSSKINFDDNDYLILFSDGLFSVVDGEHRYFSQEDFVTILKKYINPHIEPNELMFDIVQELEEVYAKGHVLDDISMLIIKL